MKTNVRKTRTAKIPTARWLAYASAGAATALTGVSPAEADIHYSGRVDVSFPANENKSVPLPLDQAGDSIIFERSINDGAADFFGAAGLKSGAFLGSYASASPTPMSGESRTGMNTAISRKVISPTVRLALGRWGR